MHQSAKNFACLLTASVAWALALTIVARGAVEVSGEWRGYAGSNAGLKYSPLDQINTGNVKNLTITLPSSI